MNIVVAEDQKRIRAALRVLLEQQAGWTVVGEASNAFELLIQSEHIKPDLVLIDETLPGMNKNQVLDAVREICPGIRIVALVDPNSVGHTGSGIHADAYATKVNSPDFLLSAIRNCIQKGS